MLARLRKSEDHEGGFTLIELLVVMIIIGILAAIAIPAFLSQKKKGYEASQKSDLRAIATEISTALVDNPTAVTVTHHECRRHPGLGRGRDAPSLARQLAHVGQRPAGQRHLLRRRRAQRRGLGQQLADRGHEPGWDSDPLQGPVRCSCCSCSTVVLFC